MLSESAFVKLGWVIGNYSSKGGNEKVKEKMLENLSNEFNPRINDKEFMN